jgi:hypothetical protein
MTQPTEDHPKRSVLEGLRNWLVLFWPTCPAYDPDNRDGYDRCRRLRWHGGRHHTWGHHSWK